MHNRKPRSRTQGHSDLPREGDDDEEDEGGSGWSTCVPPAPLFKLTPGIASTSHGIACAEIAGEIDIESGHRPSDEKNLGLRKVFLEHGALGEQKGKEEESGVYSVEATVDSNPELGTI